MWGGMVIRAAFFVVLASWFWGGARAAVDPALCGSLFQDPACREDCGSCGEEPSLSFPPHAVQLSCCTAHNYPPLINLKSATTPATDLAALPTSLPRLAPSSLQPQGGGGILTGDARRRALLHPPVEPRDLGRGVRAKGQGHGSRIDWGEGVCRGVRGHHSRPAQRAALGAVRGVWDGGPSRDGHDEVLSDQGTDVPSRLQDVQAGWGPRMMPPPWGVVSHATLPPPGTLVVLRASVCVQWGHDLIIPSGADCPHTDTHTAMQTFTYTQARKRLPRNPTSLLSSASWCGLNAITLTGGALPVLRTGGRSRVFSLPHRLWELHGQGVQPYSDSDGALRRGEKLPKLALDSGQARVVEIPADHPLWLPPDQHPSVRLCDPAAAGAAFTSLLGTYHSRMASRGQTANKV